MEFFGNETGSPQSGHHHPARFNKLSYLSPIFRWNAVQVG